MKTIRNLLLLATILCLFACSVQSKLKKKFVGKDKTELDKFFEQKGVVIPISEEKQCVVYSKSKFLKDIAINKGVTTLDPMVSPSVEKKQKFTFYLDNAGKVMDCKYEMDYTK